MKNVIVILVLCFTSSVTLADWSVDASIGQFSEKFSNERLEMSFMSIGASYQVKLKDNWFVRPSFSIGQGIGNYDVTNSVFIDTLDISEDIEAANVSIEIDSIFEFNVKAGYFFTEKAFLHAIVSNTHIDFKTSAKNQNSVTVKESSLDETFGLGFGLGYAINKDLIFEINVKRINTDNMSNLSLFYIF